MRRIRNALFAAQRTSVLKSLTQKSRTSKTIKRSRIWQMYFKVRNVAVHKISLDEIVLTNSILNDRLLFIFFLNTFFGH